MTLLNYMMMSSFLLKSSFVILFIQQYFSAPINTPYFNFVANLTQNSCVLPSQIPFSISANETTVEDSLLICKTPDYYKFNKEVPILCKEIFGLLMNISCPPFNTAVSKFQISLSTDVCSDFESYKAVLPKGLLLHLSDSFNCKIMCSENFEAPCKVLLWSFLVQHHILNSETQDTSLKTTKNSSQVEAKTTPNLQTSVQNNTKNATKSDSLKPSAVKVPDEIAGYPTSNAAENSKESTKPIEQLPDQPKQETVASVDNAPETSMINPEAPTLETKLSGVAKLMPSIPVNTTSSSEKDTGESVNDGLVNNDTPNLISKVPLDKTENNADTKPQQELPAVLDEQNSQTLFDLKEPAVGAVSTTNQETENGGSDVQAIITVPDNIKNKETTSKTVQSSRKEDISLAPPPIVTLPSNLPVEPTKDTAAVSGEEKSESVPSPSSAVSVSVTPSLERMDEEIPLPNDKENDQYNLDNAEGDLDGEYSKQDYGDGMYEPTKNKDSISAPPKSVEIPKEPIVPQNDEKAFNGLSRGSFGRGSEEIQEFATFPDQEDSHFFFYFLSIVLILMAGYLIFHNKQKIIALIVEGRHERRRRSHGLGYKKLETK